MQMFPILLSLALINTQTNAAPLPEGCALHMSETGKMVTLKGVVDPKGWRHGTYKMNIVAQQGGNRSVSRQSGSFDDSNAETANGLIVLSTTTLYVSKGSRLAVTLQIEDGDRHQSCSFDYER